MPIRIFHDALWVVIWTMSIIEAGMNDDVLAVCIPFQRLNDFVSAEASTGIIFQFSSQSLIGKYIEREHPPTRLRTEVPLQVILQPACFIQCEVIGLQRDLYI